MRPPATSNQKPITIMSTTPPSPASPGADSPRWSTNTKIIVVVVFLLLLLALIWRFTGIIRLLTIAAILAYLVNPVVALLHEQTRLSRGLAIAVVYLTLVAALLTGATVLGVTVFNETSAFINQSPALIRNFINLLSEWTSQTEPIDFFFFELAPVNVNWDALVNQLLGYVEPLASRSGRILTSFATTTVAVLGQLFLVVIISIYLTAEIPKLGGYVVRFAQTPGYHKDAERLLGYTKVIWGSYLRGQVILGLVIGVVTAVGLTILGVQSALAIGILAGLLEFVPNLGPIITAIVAIVVALLQPDNYLGLTNIQLALAVLVFMIVVQQLENTLLVPRIVGNSLNIHPLLVLLAVLMGASLAGILGAVLAAPILASFKLIGIYTWRKMFDLPPFADETLFPNLDPLPRVLPSLAKEEEE
jgi:predicted PurR-regulated permease PerM